MMRKKSILSVLSFAPRLVQLGSLAALGLSLQGCVSARHYEEARSVAESETAAHGRTRARLEAAAKRIHALELDLAQKEKVLTDRESAVAQSKLDTTVAQKETEAATMLVEQLRSELARTGDHLSSFSREKRDLQQALILAEQRLLGIELAEKRLAELVGATRDLALVLGEELEKQRVDLGAKAGQVVVGMTADKLFPSIGDAVLPGADPVLAGIGAVSLKHPNLRVIVREPPNAPLAGARMRHLGEALRERGIAETRLSLPSAPLEQPAAAPVADGAAAPTSAPPSEADPAQGAEPTRTPEKKPALALPAVDPSSLRYEIAFAL